MHSGFGRFWLYKSQGFQGSLKRVPSFMFEGSLRLSWLNLNFGGNWFWLSSWNKEYPIMLNTLQVMGFYLKGLDFGVSMLNWRKRKQKNLQATGGTLRRHRGNPN